MWFLVFCPVAAGQSPLMRPVSWAQWPSRLLQARTEKAGPHRTKVLFPVRRGPGRLRLFRTKPSGWLRAQPGEGNAAGPMPVRVSAVREDATSSARELRWQTESLIAPVGASNSTYLRIAQVGQEAVQGRLFRRVGAESSFHASLTPCLYASTSGSSRFVVEALITRPPYHVMAPAPPLRVAHGSRYGYRGSAAPARPIVFGPADTYERDLLLSCAGGASRTPVTPTLSSRVSSVARRHPK